MLKTLCENCIFSNINEKCLLKKETFLHNNRQHTYGFCRHKRQPLWLENQSDKTLKGLVDKVQSEEKKIAVIIHLKDNINNAVETINCVGQDLDYLSEFVIVAKSNELFKQLHEKIKYLTTPWSMCYLTDSNDIDDLYMLDFGVDSLNKKTPWFLFLEAGQIIDTSFAIVIKAILNGNNNIVAAFKDNKLFSNKYAFLELGGNQQGPYIEKLKSFPQWEQHCIRMS